MDSSQLLMQLTGKVTTEFRDYIENNEISSDLFAKLKEFNHDKSILLITLRHLKTVEDILRRKAVDPNASDFESEDARINFYVSSFFLKNIGKFLNSNLPFNVDYITPTKLIPIEAFLKPDKESIQKFEKNLKQYDVLFGEVVKTSLADENGECILLRIINKVDDNDDIVYHLNINVHLFKKQELACRPGKEFQVSEILLVVMLATVKYRISGEIKHYATTNLNFLREKNKLFDLESLSHKKPAVDLSLFKEASKFSCYAHYLESTAEFSDKNHLINGINSLGLDPYRIYSFNEEDGLINPEGFHVDAIRNAAQENQQKESNYLLNEANKFVEDGDIINALSAFDESLKIWPENFAVFECRGRMYGDYKKNKQFCDLKKASLDFASALKINENAEVAKKGLSHIFLCLAIKLKKKEKYEECKKCLEAALKLDNGNEKANILLQKVNKKLSISSKSDDSEILALENERQKLLLALDAK